MIRTALFVDRSGRLYFGEAAVDTATSVDQEPFDTIKEALIEAGNARDFNDPLPPEHSPVSRPITKRHAITLFLAFFTRAVLRAPRAPESSVPRSIAMPVFPEHKAKFVSEMLQESLTHAHVLAEQFADDLFGSIDLQSAIRLLEELRNRSISLRPIAETTTVVEPVAAVSAQLLHYTPSGNAPPGLLMVVDVGAGTTDIAMFAAGQVRGMVTVRHVHGSKRSIPVAGKALDKALIDHIVGKSNAKGVHGVHALIRAKALIGHIVGKSSGSLEAHLLREGRGQPMKEELFRDGRVSRYGVSTSVQDFLDSAPALVVIAALKEAFDNALLDIDRSFFQRQVAVRFSGGGAFLPFLDRFVRHERLLPVPPNERSPLVRMASAAREPQWSAEPGYQNLYREVGTKFTRMAVAVGGAYYGAEGRSWLRLDEDIAWLGSKGGPT